MKLLDILNTSLEEIVDTTQVLETEIIVYCKINNFDGLQKATSISEHEQLETNFQNGVRCRSRKTVKDNEETYTFTFKVKTSEKDEENGYEANREYTATVDKDFFEGFKEASEHRLSKTRYEFASDKIQLIIGDTEDKTIIEVPDIKYEIDVYKNKDNEVCEWCKIDIEIDPILDYLNQHHPELENIKLNIKLSHLPFEPSDSILTTAMTDDQKAFIDSLWKDQFHLDPIEQKEDDT